MPNDRPTPRVIAFQAVALVVVCAVAVLTAPQGNWNVGLLLVLFAFAAFSDLTAITDQRPDQDLGQLPRPGPGDGLPRRPAGGAARRPHHRRRLAALARRPARPDQQPADLRDLPAGRRPRLHRGRHPGQHQPRRAAVLRARLRPLPGRARDQLRDDRGLRLLPGAGPVLGEAEGAAAGAAVGVRERDAGDRGRLHLPRDRDRGDRPLRRRLDHLPVPARAAAALPAAGRGAGDAQQTAGQLPGRDVERDAAHARPARPDDRPPLGGGGALLAGDRPAGRLLAARGGARPHRRAAARHRQVHPSRPHPQGQRAAHRRGLDADQAPSPAGRPGGLLARRLRPGGGDHPRPPRADRRQRLSARACRRRHPRALADHLRRRHLRRDDRPRLLPDADVEL